MLSSYYEQDGITIYNARCEQVLPFLDPVDLVLTDPPYGLGDKWKSGGWREGKCGRGRLWEASVADWDERPAKHVIDAVIAHGTNAIVWGGNYFALPEARCWLLWDKDANMDQAHAEMAWTTLDKPVRKLKLSPLGVFGNGGANGERKEHPTQKPLAVMKWAISQAPDTVQTVLDPFMGVGTTLVAAKLMGKRAIGIEVSTEYCERAVERLRQGVLPFAG